MSTQKTQTFTFRFFIEFFLILGTLLFIKFFIIDSVQVKGESMIPTYQDKQLLVLGRSHLLFGTPTRGDVVVLRKKENKDYFLKRVIAIGGDKLKFHPDGKLSILEKGSTEYKTLSEDYILEESSTYLPMFGKQDWPIEYEIPEGKYWVLGDNRKNSLDSRQCFKECDELYDVDPDHFLSGEEIAGKIIYALPTFSQK